MCLFLLLTPLLIVPILYLTHMWTTRNSRRKLSLIEAWKPILMGDESTYIIEVDISHYNKLTFDNMIAMQNNGVEMFAGDQYVNKWPTLQPDGTHSIVVMMKSKPVARFWMQPENWDCIEKWTNVKIISARTRTRRNLLFGTWERAMESMNFLVDGYGFFF